MWQTLVIDQSHINQKIDIFKAGLRDYSITEKLIVQKYIISKPKSFAKRANHYGYSRYHQQMSTEKQVLS
ncbi:MAG: hypothetical protein V7K72_04000, partial [Nostoc sp.]